MEEKNSLDIFSSASVPKAVLKNAVPAIGAMLMVLVYNLADTFFISQTHDDIQVVAISLATPVFLLFMAVGTIFGIGGTSVISRSMGKGNREYAKKVCSFCMWSCVFAGILMALFMGVFMDNILALIGASNDTWAGAKSYLMIAIWCGPFVLIANCYSNILRAEGQSNKAMMGMVIGNLLNVILDPVMILIFKWNIAGAAIATVICNIAGAVYYILYFIRGNSMLSISIKDFTLKERVCRSVLSIGIPASLGSILMSISNIIMNSQMTDYGDMALAGIGVAMKVTMITGMICIGFGQGVQPLLGFCVGAKAWDRYEKVMKFSVWFSIIAGVLLTVFCYIFLDGIINIFLTDKAAFDYGVEFAKILLSTSSLFGIFYVLTNALQAMGASAPSLIVNVSRQGLIYIPSLFILKALVGMTGLVWAQPVADVLSLTIAFVLYMKALKSYESENLKGEK
ncbi:MAG: MATE family efflux transporter [Clostridia bacterium]|nr:MATE family efflux transporter [Clostridia bacterium]